MLEGFGAIRIASRNGVSGFTVTRIDSDGIQNILGYVLAYPTGQVFVFDSWSEDYVSDIRLSAPSILEAERESIGHAASLRGGIEILIDYVRWGDEGADWFPELGYASAWSAIA
jgi:hypothetical protein